MTRLYDLCPHDSDPFCCIPCNNTQTSREVRRTSVTVRARYQGRCPRCADPIEIDDLLTLVEVLQADDDSDELWICEDCLLVVPA